MNESSGSIGEEWGKTTSSSSTASSAKKTSPGMENGKAGTSGSAATATPTLSHLRRKGESASAIPVGIAVAWKRTDIKSTSGSNGATTASKSSTKSPDPTLSKNGEMEHPKQDCNISKKLPTPISSPKVPKRPSSNTSSSQNQTASSRLSMPERPSSVMPSSAPSVIPSSILRNPYIDSSARLAFPAAYGYGAGSWFGYPGTLQGPTKSELLMMSAYPHLAQQQQMLEHMQQQQWAQQHQEQLVRESYAAHGLLPHGILPEAYERHYAAYVQQQLQQQRQVQNFHQSIANHGQYETDQLELLRSAAIVASLPSPNLSIPSPSLLSSGPTTNATASGTPTGVSSANISSNSSSFLWSPEYYQNCSTTLSPRSLASSASPSPSAPLASQVSPVLLHQTVPKHLAPHQAGSQQPPSGDKTRVSSLPLGGETELERPRETASSESSKSVVKKPTEEPAATKSPPTTPTKSPKRTLEAITASLATTAAAVSSSEVVSVSTVEAPGLKEEQVSETSGEGAEKTKMKLEHFLGANRRRHDFSCMESLIEKRDEGSVPLLKFESRKDSQEKKPLCSPNSNLTPEYFAKSGVVAPVISVKYGEEDGVPEENLPVGKVLVGKPPKKSPQWKREMLDKEQAIWDARNSIGNMPDLVKVEKGEEDGVRNNNPLRPVEIRSSSKCLTNDNDVKEQQGIVKLECDTDVKCPSNMIVPLGDKVSASLATSVSEPNISVSNVTSDLYAPSAALLQLASAIASVGNMSRIQQQGILPMEKRRNTTDCDYRQLGFDDQNSHLNLLATVALGGKAVDQPGVPTAATAAAASGRPASTSGIFATSSPSIQSSAFTPLNNGANSSQSSISVRQPQTPASRPMSGHPSPPMASVAPAVTTPPMGTESVTAAKSGHSRRSSSKSPKRKGRQDSKSSSNDEVFSPTGKIPKLKLRKSPVRYVGSTEQAAEYTSFQIDDDFEIAKPSKKPKKQVLFENKSTEEKKVLPLKLKKRRLTEDAGEDLKMKRSNNSRGRGSSSSSPLRRTASANKDRMKEEKKKKTKSSNMMTHRPDLKIKIVNNQSSLMCVDSVVEPNSFMKSRMHDIACNGTDWTMSSPAPTTTETATTVTTDWEADPTLAVKAIQVEVNKTSQWLAQHMSRFGKHVVGEEEEEDDISSNPVNMRSPNKKSPARKPSGTGPTVKPCLKAEAVVKQASLYEYEDEDEELPSINGENSNDAKRFVPSVFARINRSPRRFSSNASAANTVQNDEDTSVSFSGVDELVDEMRILTEIQGLFYTGRLNALQPPDVYGVTLDNERGAPPHFIFSAEEVLEKCIRELKPSKLSHGLRICAYWSPMYSGLYAGKVSVDYVPGESRDIEMVPIEFDDGDTGLIKRTEIRMLPQDHPMREHDPNPLQTLEKKHRKRRHSSANTSRSGCCNGDHEEDDCGEPYCAKLPKLLEDEDQSLYGYQNTKLLYWTWKGLGFRKPKSKKDRNKEFFNGIQRGDEEINVGDAALFVSHGNVRPYIGRVEKFYEKKGKKVVSVRWFYHPEEVQVSPKKLQGLKYAGALFESPHIDENDVQTIARKCDVRAFDDFRKCNPLVEWSKDRTYTGESYYVAGFYDPYKYSLQLKDLRY